MPFGVGEAGGRESKEQQRTCSEMGFSATYESQTLVGELMYELN
jgi:hypothetical protein